MRYKCLSWYKCLSFLLVGVEEDLIVKRIEFVEAFFHNNILKFSRSWINHPMCSRIKSSFAPKVPSRGHSSQQKKWRLTGAEWFSGHLLQKSPRALGKAVKSWPPSNFRTLDSCFFFDEEGIFMTRVRWNINMQRFFCLQIQEERCVSDEAQKMDCLKLLQLWSAVGTHCLLSGSAVCRVASEERMVSQPHSGTNLTQRTRKSEPLRVKTGVLVLK